MPRADASIVGEGVPSRQSFGGDDSRRSWELAGDGNGPWRTLAVVVGRDASEITCQWGTVWGVVLATTTWADGTKQA